MSIKRCFVSRFKDGYIVEGDLAQIEVIVQAFLSGDKKMKQDVWDGVDFHVKRLAWKFNKPYNEIWNLCHVQEDPNWIKERKRAKQFSFQRSYGAGAKAIANSTGMDEQEVKAFIEAEDKMYPGVVQMQDAWVEEVQRNRKPSRKRTLSGKPAGVSHLTSITGKRYVFYEEDTPDFIAKKTGNDTGFKPTQIKNYPVQGFAGEIIKIILVQLYRELKKDPELKNKALLINTVHDSIVLDVHPEAIHKTCKLVQDIIEDGPELIHSWFGFKFDLPIKGEITYGRNWEEQTEYKFD